MRNTLSILPALLACAMLTSSCATFVPASAPTRPPQREMPAQATTPCALPRLPDQATAAELESAFTARGVALLACDAARQLAVDVHAAEKADQETWLRAQTPTLSLRRLFGGR